MWKKDLELGIRRPGFSVRFLFLLITDSLGACQTPSPMLSYGKLKIAIEIIKKRTKVIQ